MDNHDSRAEQFMRQDVSPGYARLPFSVLCSDRVVQISNNGSVPQMETVPRDELFIIVPVGDSENMQHKRSETE